MLDSAGVGIGLYGSSGNTVVNNFFDNGIESNAYDDGANTWHETLSGEKKHRGRTGFRRQLLERLFRRRHRRQRHRRHGCPVRQLRQHNQRRRPVPADSPSGGKCQYRRDLRHHLRCRFRRRYPGRPRHRGERRRLQGKRIHFQGPDAAGASRAGSDIHCRGGRGMPSR